MLGGEQRSLMERKELGLHPGGVQGGGLVKVWVLQINRWEMHSGEGILLVAFSFLPHHEACGILVPLSGLNALSSVSMES